MAVGPGIKFPAVHSQLPVLDLIVGAKEVLEGQHTGCFPQSTYREAFVSRPLWPSGFRAESRGVACRLALRGAEGTNTAAFLVLPFPESVHEQAFVCLSLLFSASAGGK